MARQNTERDQRHDSHDDHGDMQKKMHLRIAAMILTGMVVM